MSFAGIDPGDLVPAHEPEGVGELGGLDFKAVWQITSMSLGIGVFSIPTAFNTLGPGQGTFWILVLGFLANFAQQRLLDVTAEHGIRSYEGLVDLALGRCGDYLMTSLTMVTTFIACLSYVSAGRELLQNVIASFLLDIDVNAPKAGVEVLSKNKSIIFTILLVISAMPLCLTKTLGGNAWISIMGVFGVMTSSIYFVYSCASLLAQGCDDTCGTIVPQPVQGDITDVAQYVATLAFSYSMVFALFPVLNERIHTEAHLKPAVATVKKCVSVGVAMCSVIYVTVGLVGSYTFRERTKGVALGNLSLEHPMAQAVTLLLGVASILLVGIVSFPTIASIEKLVGMMRPQQARDTGTSNARPLLLVGVGIAIIIIDSFLPTKIAFALCGSLGLASSAYLMPCVLYLKLSNARNNSLARGLSWVVVIFGLALLFGSTPVTLYKLITGHTSGDLTPKTLKDMFCTGNLTTV